MRKVLPVNTANHITTEISNHIRLAAVLSDDAFLPWFVENFIVLFADKNYLFSDYYPYGWPSARNLFDEVLCSEPFAVKEGIADEVKKRIHNGQYVQLFCDKFYVDGSVYFRKHHFLHELLIAGCDEDAAIFYFVDLNINRKVTGLHPLPFGSLEEAWAAGMEQIKGKSAEELYDLSFMQLDFPAAAFTLRKDLLRREPNLNRIYYALQLCHKERQFRSEQFGMLSEKTTGHRIYELYYNNLCEKLKLEEFKNLLSLHNNVILISLKRLIENKQGHYFRFNYLMEKNLLPRDSVLLEKLQRIPGELQTAFNALAKFSFSFAPDLLDEAAGIFRRLERLDEESMEQGLSLVAGAIKERYGFH